MRKLSFEQIESYSAKGVGDFVTGACAGLAGAGALAWTLRLASNLHPVAKGVYGATLIGCAAWAAYTM